MGAGGFSDSGLAVADAQGYFKEQGLILENVTFNSLAAMVPALGTGELHAGGGGITAGLYNAAARGVAMRIVADSATNLKSFSNVALMVRKDLIDSGTIKEPADLRGKAIALPSTASATEVLLADIFKQGGLTFEDARVINIGGFAEMPTALANKSVDVAVMVEPMATQVADKGIAVAWKTGDQINPNQQSAVMVYSQQFAKTEAAKRFMVAYIKGIRDYNDAFRKNKNKDKIVAILANFNKVPADIILRAKMAGLNPDGYADAPSIMAIQDYFLSTGAMTERVTLDQLVDTQFVEYALQKLGKYSYD